MPAGAWTIETVADIADTLNTSAIAADSSNRIHVAYDDQDADDLLYALKSSGTWTYTTVDTENDVGNMPTIAVDGSNYPHIAHYDSTNKDLRYAYQDGEGWHLETVDSDGDVGRQPSIAIGPDDLPSISYQDFTNKRLKCAKRVGGVWTPEIVDSRSVSVGTYSSIDIASDGYPHIAYYHTIQTGPLRSALRYAYKDGAGWHTEQVYYHIYEGHTCSMVLDDDDVAHIVHIRDVFPGELLYSTGVSGSWNTEMLDSPAQLWCSIAQSATELQVSYYGDVDELAYTYYNGAWNYETVDTGITVMTQQRIAVDVGGYPHIVYRKDDNILHAYKYLVTHHQTHFILA